MEIVGGGFSEKQNIMTRKIVRSLSQDARLSITKLCKATGGYRRIVRNRLNKAEEELGIKYTVEFNEAAIGLNSPHIVMVKLNPASDREEIETVLKDSYVPQMAAFTKGKYDLVIYANAPTSSEYVYWDKTTQVRLSRYVASWEPSDVAHRQFGFFPIRNVLLERLKFPEEYKKMLLYLNENSRIRFGALAKALGMYQNTLAYKFRGLMREGYIKRFTMVMNSLKGISSVGFFGKYAMKENFEIDASKQRQIFFSEGLLPLSSRYIFVSQLVGSYDFFSVGVFDSYKIALEEGVMNYRKTMKRHLVKLGYAEIEKVILGSLPIRSLDTKQEYSTIRWV